jgi:hypothetical protein
MFVETVLAAGNELERHQNKRQVIQKMKARLEAGYWPFGAKRGYKMILDPIHGKLCVPDGNEAKLLKKAVEGFSTGLFARKIDACIFLVENGFWKREPKMYVYLFDKILRDPFFAGFIEYLEWDVSRREGHHKGIISLATFENNQKRLSKVSINKRIRTDVSPILYLRGLLNCACCGHHLSGGKTNGNGGVYWYYFCQNKSCRLFRKSIDSAKAHDEFEKLLVNQTLKPDTEKLASLIFNRVWKDEMDNLKMVESKELKRRALIDEKIDRLTNMAISAKSEKITRVYEKQIEKLAGELEQTSNSPKEKPNFDLPYRTALDKAFGMLKSPYKIWESVDVIEKHRLFFFLFEEKLIYSKETGYTTNTQ